MPTYQYQCRECGHSFDQFQKFSEDPLTVCPSCGGVVARVIQNVGVVFKGSGWYINDSRKPSEPATSAAKGSSDSASKDDKAKSGDTATKTEPKSEPVKATTTAAAE